MNTCASCLQSSRRLFFLDGRCEVCCPGAISEASKAPLIARTPDPAWADWVSDLMLSPEEGLSDAECDVILACRRGWMTERHYAEIAELFSKRRTAPTAQLTGLHLGVPGQRLDIAGAQCVECKSLGPNPEHPEWGHRFLIRFLTPAGHELVWFAGEGGKFDARVGSTYSLRATVKQHGVYAGRRTTVILRPTEQTRATDGKTAGSGQSPGGDATRPADRGPSGPTPEPGGIQ